MSIIVERRPNQRVEAG